MTETESIALFGGSFDPIHLGHLGLLEKVSSQLTLEGIHLIPCKQSPHKENAPIANDQQRLDMCKLATSHLPYVQVSDLEVTRPTPSYSWMTVKHYQKQYPSANLYWILGTDQWDALERWSKVDFLRQSLTFIVIERQQRVIEKKGFRHIAVSFDHEISATNIRNLLKEGQPVTNLISPEVSDYIATHKLYPS